MQWRPGQEDMGLKHHPRGLLQRAQLGQETGKDSLSARVKTGKARDLLGTGWRG